MGLRLKKGDTIGIFSPSSPSTVTAKYGMNVLKLFWRKKDL